MTTFQTEYETNTNAIDSIVSTQLSSVLNWVDIPGSVVKASSSISGFVWGYNSAGTVYTCQLPCSGNWKEVDFSQYQVSRVLDLTTDQTNLYLLYSNSAGSTSLLVTPATNQGVPTVIALPFSATSIFSTHTYVWAQDSSNNKQRCAKPCNMPNWQVSTDTTVTITSSDDGMLYGKDASGQAMQTDETLQTPWQPIGEVHGTIYGKGTDGTLYGIDQSQNAFQYNGTIKSLYTNGLPPANLSVDNQSNQVWMTTSTPGNLGNIFTRLQKPDYTSIMNTLSPIDRTRDKIADTVETKFERQTDVMVVNKQTNDIVAFFKKIFNIDKDTAKKANDQAGHLNENIRESQKQLDQILSVEPIIFGVIGLLVIVTLLYTLGSPILGSYVHTVALVTLGVGMALLMNFSDAIK
jgi:hypothetical protein